MDAQSAIIGEPKPQQGFKEVFKLKPAHPDMQPVVPLDKLFDPKLPANARAVEGKIGRKGVKDLIKNGGPDPKGKDLRNVPNDEYPTKYEEPKQTLIELMLTTVNAVDSETLQKAIDLQAKLAAIDIQQADAPTLIEACNEHWKISRILNNASRDVQTALTRFNAAFRMGADRPAFTPESSLVYQVDNDLSIQVLPETGLYIRRDPNVLLWQGLTAGNKKGSIVEWLQEAINRSVPATITANDLTYMRQPQIIHHKVAGDYSKYADEIFRASFFDNEIVSGKETFSVPFGQLAQTAIFTALSEGNIPTEADRKAAQEIDLDRNIWDKLTNKLDEKFFLNLGRDRQKYGRFVAGAKMEMHGEITQILANQAALVGLTKLTLSDFDPRYMDIQNWVIVKRDGKLAYLKDALDETIAKANSEDGKEAFVKLAETCRDRMRKLHMAVEQETGEHGGTQQGLVMTREQLFQPLKLDGGGEWRTKTPAEAHTIREMWLAEGEPKLDDPAQAAVFLDDVYGIKVNTDPSKGPLTTEKDWMLMVRKTIAAQLPIYAGPDAFFLNKDFGEILAKTKEIVHASRTAARDWKLNSQTQ